MYHFEYVTKSQAAPVKKELIAILNKVQDILRDHFTFQYFFHWQCCEEYDHTRCKK
jgi:hypothetical protein